MSERKKGICLLLVLALFASLWCGAFAEAAAETAPAHQIVAKACPFYLDSGDNVWKEDYPVYFLDGAEDLPYTDVRDWVDAMSYFLPELSSETNKGFRLAVVIEEADNTVVVTRERCGFPL